MKHFLVFLSLLSMTFFSTLSAKPGFHLVTVANKETDGLNRLKKSCEFNNLKLHVMGMGLPYKGNGMKLSYIKQYVADLPDDDIVLFVDAFDVIILAKKSKILEKFYSFNVPCIIGAETFLYPHVHLKEQFPPSPTKFKYLNSGCIMGYVSYLKKMLGEMKINPMYSDQGQLQLYYVKHQSEIGLDFMADLVINLFDVSKSELKINKISKSVDCLTTGTTPCIFHGNGPSKILCEHIFKELFEKD